MGRYDDHDVEARAARRAAAGSRRAASGSDRRRRTAAVRVGLRELPVVVRDIENTEMIKLAPIESLQRKDLTPLPNSPKPRARSPKPGEIL